MISFLVEDVQRVQVWCWCLSDMISGFDISIQDSLYILLVFCGWHTQRNSTASLNCRFFIYRQGPFYRSCRVDIRSYPLHRSYRLTITAILPGHPGFLGGDSDIYLVLLTPDSVVSPHNPPQGVSPHRNRRKPAARLPSHSW